MAFRLKGVAEGGENDSIKGQEGTNVILTFLT